MKRIKIAVSPTGQVTVKTEGYAGPECEQAAAPFVAALGHAARVEPTPEMYAAHPPEGQKA